VTRPTPEHARYDELAAGHALHALDPDDERQFLDHLRDCARCQNAVSDFTDVTAALADACPAAEPSPLLGERIMASLAREPAAGTPGTGPPAARAPAASAPPAGSRRRFRTLAATAAAAVVLAGGGTAWGVLSGSGSSPARPAAGCVRAGDCQQVQLTGARSRAPAGKVIIADGTAWLVPSGLPADNTTRQVYVLWQITGAHIPLAVGSFDVRGHGSAPVRIGALAVPYHGTWAFAVSLEHGRAIPATPSHPVALGQVTS
jgi:anti-sigma-K factor RskA